MRHLLLTLVILFPVTVQAAVVRTDGNDHDSGWWREGNTQPYAFGVLDADGDGKVTQAEADVIRHQLDRGVKETRAGLLDALDKDENGKVSRFEAGEGKGRFKSLLDQARAIAIATYDKDGDGKLSEVEAKPIIGRIQGLFTKFETASVDADKDRRIESSEVVAALTKVLEGNGALFTMCDRNIVGYLKSSEANLGFDLLLAVAER